MPHFPKPFFKKSRGVWYVQIGRQQVNLGPNRDDAFRAYHELMTVDSGQRLSHVYEVAGVAGS